VNAARRLARWRVPLGFASGAVALWLAQPSMRSLAIGGATAVAGELLRIWAAGHIEKGREITRSGPYRLVRHPLYVGSSIMGIGFVIAAASWVVALLVGVYLATTLTAAVRTEEATLDERFAGEYSAYRAGKSAPVARDFSFARVLANREHRSAIGLILALLALYLKVNAP
jgi:protein-S-isoprenylcysteine O-methyltransferase Ste14